MEKFYIVSIILISGLNIFAPPVSFFLAVSLLLFFNQNTYSPRLCAGFIIFNIIVSVSIFNISIPNFLIGSDDFSTYYNNYLDFLSYGFDTSLLTVFGGGIEILLPFLNYLLSTLIGEPEPYKLKFILTALQVLLLTMCLLKISKKLELSIYEFILLYALVLIFYKSNVSIQFLRQSFASFFIVFAIFSNKKESYIYVFIASLFHLSTLIIYPITIYLLTNRTSRDFKVSLFFLLAISILMPVLLTFLVGLNHPLFSKLVYLYNGISSGEAITQSILKSILMSIYLLPLVFYCLICKLVLKKEIFFSNNVYIMFFAILLFSYIPGMINRVLFLPNTILLGYFYYMVLFYKNRLNGGRLVIFILFLMTNVNWVFFSSSIYYRFPMVTLSPFYYFDNINENQSYIYRSKLHESIKLINDR